MSIRIPDCPQGMGNANDWMQERERRGFPQNRTVSIEHTVYHDNGKTKELLDKLDKVNERIAEIRYAEGYDVGYEDGFHDAIEDIIDALKTDLSTDSVIKALEAEPCDVISVDKRYSEIAPIVTRFATIIVRKKDSK